MRLWIKKKEEEDKEHLAIDLAGDIEGDNHVNWGFLMNSITDMGFGNKQRDWLSFTHALSNSQF